MNARRPGDDQDVFPDYTLEYDGPEIVRAMAGGGLTLRDWFAGHALCGLLASGQNESLAPRAYALADTLLDQRGRGA